MFVIDALWTNRGLGLLFSVQVSKFCDHLPLYRQSQIFGREGIDLDRSTLSDWVGRSTALLEPLADAIGQMIRQGNAVFADLEDWLHAQLSRTFGKSALAGAIRYAATRLTKAWPYMDAGHLGLDNKVVERAMKPVALGRKISLHRITRGGKVAATAYILIQTANYN